MKVLIIEDEAPASRRLKKLIEEIDNTIEIVGIVESVKDGIGWFSDNPHPELILSDIQLADDLSFTIFRELKITVPIIFITAFDEYAINAFKFYSIDYLLKPIDAADLKSSLQKYKSIHQKAVPGNLDGLLKMLEQRNYRERFLVYSGDSLIPVSCQDIAYFVSEDGTTILVTCDNKRFHMDDSLETLESEINPKHFFRANRQYLISLNSIRKISNYGLQKLKITLCPSSPDDIFVSKLKATQFKKWLDQ